jgi:hypothetical protein
VYTYYVSSRRVEGSSDLWTVSVAVGGVDVEIQQASGASPVFSFRYFREAPGSQPGACSSSSDCGLSQVCIEQFCVEKGTDQFILAYSGDDDLDLYVITPIGTTFFS